MVFKNKWDELLKSININKNDFFYVESRKIHAIKANTIIFELQQSSDITYRVYDYNRLDNGKLRELHLNDVFNLIETPEKPTKQKSISNNPDYLVSNKLFKLKLIDKNSNKKQVYTFPKAKWIQLTIIQGSGTINDFKIKKYDSFLIAHNQDVIAFGRMKFFVYYVE